MHKNPHTHLIDEATHLRSLGFGICRILAKEKTPTYGEWTRATLEPSDFEQFQGANLGILGGAISGNLAIVDLDRPEIRAEGARRLPRTMTDGRPSTGPAHWYFRVCDVPDWATAGPSVGNGQGGHKIMHFADGDKRPIGFDFLGTGAQVVCPPSLHDSGERRLWLIDSEQILTLPYLDLWPIVKQLAKDFGATNTDRERERPAVAVAGERRILSGPVDTHTVKRAISYLARCDAAISGQGGHSVTMWAARAIVWGFDLGAEVGFDLLQQHYNPRCEPPWSDAELMHKCEDADCVEFDKPRGWLLDAQPNTEQKVSNGRSTATMSVNQIIVSEPPAARANGHQAAPDIPELACDTQPLRTIGNDLAAVGIVGEADSAMLVYLAYTSRVLPEPAAIVARGIRGSGKSVLQTKTATLFPSEVKIEAMQMSAAAWFNTPDDFFKHKVFISGERKHATNDEAKDAGACLRQLLSEKRIHRGVSVYNEQAKGWSTQWIERPGPVAYAETTTSRSIFEEDLDRMLQIYTDNSEERKRNVLDAIGSKYDPDCKRPDLDAIIKRHHHFQLRLQALAPIRVGVPYHRAVTSMLPADGAGVFRTTQLLFTIIQTVAVIHCGQREERNGHLIATLDDYAVARQLLMAPLSMAIGIGEWHGVAELLRKVTKPDVEFTTPYVKQALGFKHDMGPSRLLSGLVEAAVIVKIREHSGRTPAAYKWADNAGARLAILPTVEEVEEAEAELRSA